MLRSSNGKVFDDWVESQRRLKEDMSPWSIQSITRERDFLKGVVARVSAIVGEEIGEDSDGSFCLNCEEDIAVGPHAPSCWVGRISEVLNG